MTRNPYEHPMDLPPDVGGLTRVSGLAVSSLVFGILCCIPGSGLVGVILGGAGLLAIGKSEGRLTGRSMAFIGLVLGLLGTLAWIGLGIGARRTLHTVDQRVVTPTAEAVQALDRQDWAGAMKLLDPKANITEAQVKAFAEHVASTFGEVIGKPRQIGIEDVFGDKISSAVQKAGPTAFPIPVPLEFKKGKASIVLVAKSPDVWGQIFVGGGTLDGSLTNVAIVSGATEVWLVDPSGKKAGGAGGGTGGGGGK